MRQPINQKKLGQRSVNQTILRLDSYIDAIFITHSHLVSSSSSQLVSKSVADVMVISHSYGHMVIWSYGQSVSQSVSKSLSPFDSQPERQSVSHNQSVRQADSVNQAASQSFRKSVSEQLLSSQFASQLVEYVCQLANTTVSQ